MPNIITIAVAVIKNEEGKVFLQQRNEPGTEAHEKWNFPGGGIQFGEAPEEALKREVREEAGYEVEIVRLLPKIFTHIWDSEGQIIMLAYECRITGGSEKKQDLEVLDHRFVDPSEIASMSCLPYTKETVDLLKQ